MSNEKSEGNTGYVQGEIIWKIGSEVGEKIKDGAEFKTQTTNHPRAPGGLKTLPLNPVSECVNFHLNSPREISITAVKVRRRFSRFNSLLIGNNKCLVN